MSKQVFSNDQLAHVWAAQSQSSGRNKTGRMFFEGNTIYSYGQHYAIASIYPNNIVLINERGYSMQTGAQRNTVTRAVDHMQRFYASEPRDPRQSILDKQSKIIDNYYSIFSANSPSQWHLDHLIDSANELNTLCDIFRVNARIEFTQDMIDLAKEHIKYRVIRNDTLEGPRREKRLREELKRKREDEAMAAERRQRAIDGLPRWREGINIPEVRDLRPMLLRVKDKIVETTGGAEVPLEHAVKLLKLVQSGKAKRGAKVGHFTVSEIDKAKIQIGCHEIEISEAVTVLTPYLEVA